jgi:Raf kinase inhibitor-like YbhB/YbcL family protein
LDMPLVLTSAAFEDGAPIPVKHTRLGENIAPPLSWAGAPPDARSFALIVEDPDAPRGTFRHWGVYNIPSERSGLSGSSDTVPGGGPRFCENDFGNARYDGPQPPKGHGVHHYHFKLAALDVPSLSIPSSAGIDTMWKEAKKHAIADASLTGTFEQA